MFIDERYGTAELMLEELLDIFYNDGDPVGYVDGREIIEKMGLADQKYLDDYDNRRNGIHRYDAIYDNTMEIELFFKEFCYTSRVLEINPGQDLSSSIWIDNHYGLRPEWQREIKLRTLLDS
jgi:hypothetical protein